jgi:predicted Zn-dependent protease
MRQLPRCLLVFALGVAVVGCSLNPVSRRPEVVFVSEEQEVEAGREAAEMVASEMGLVQDAALTAYLAAIGERVAAYAPQRNLTYSFGIIDQDEPNAFALPGGYVYVSRGLLAIANSEDELANVIAHEVVHVAARHHAQRQTRATGAGLLALPGLLAGALIPGPVGDLLSTSAAVAGGGVLAGYSRSQELESDRVGQQMAAQAGYQPKALADFLATLERDSALRLERLGEERRMPGFFDTHPSTPKRASQAAERADGIAWTARPAIAGGRNGFPHRLDGILVGENPAEGVFEGRRFMHPDLDLTLVFPKRWKTLNTRLAVGALSEKGDAQIALQHQGPGNDPREASAAFFQEASEQMRIEVARLDAIGINGLRAVRGQAVAHGRRGLLSLDLTWIAHGGSIYLISGLVGDGYTDEHRALFGRVVHSFRPLEPREREGIRETRLRVHAARAGEDLKSLGRRTHNAWDVERTATANGLSRGAVLAEGQPVKIGQRQRYRGALDRPLSDADRVEILTAIAGG